MSEQNDSGKKARHDQLVDTIRGVHEHLRRSCQMGIEYEVVWNEHVKKKPLRESYAEAMKELATSFWTDADNSRITWCRSVWRWYFKEDGICRWMNKLERIYPSMVFDRRLVSGLQNLEKIKVLDVGSCYNPFGSFAECDCLAVDLTPAERGVRECDFLSVTVTETTNLPRNEEERPITELPKESFHVVVFSLLLGYMPSSFQRWRCCALACQLLSPLGLLLIITPDSKSQHKNAPMMKSWREAIEELGMHRILYKKLPHLHCLAFSKMATSDICLTGGNPQSAAKLYIPQDSNCYTQNSSQQVHEDRTTQSDNEIMEQFLLLPFSEDDDHETC